jgi:hypothetical protein
VASIIPYFHYEYGDGAEVFFNPDAWELHSETQWDPEVNVAVTPDDQQVQDIMEQDPEYQWVDLEECKDKDKEDKKKKKKKKCPDPKEKSLYGDDDGDSVSTMRSLNHGLDEARSKLELIRERAFQRERANPFVEMPTIGPPLFR